MTTSWTEVVDEGDGPPVILVHGSASDRRTWVEQRQVLVAGGYRVLSYSRRFHWPNEPAADDGDYLMSQQVEDLVAVIDGTGLDSVHLVGHSYGGYIGLVTALRHPELVDSLVAIEPPVVPLFVSDPPTPGELLRVMIRNPLMGAALVGFGASGLVPATSAARAGDMDRALEIFGKAALGKVAFGQISRERWDQVEANNIRAEYLSDTFEPITDADMRTIETKTMLVSGERSPRLWRLLVGHLETLLPNVVVKTVPDASHIVHEDNPPVFNRLLLDFLP